MTINLTVPDAHQGLAPRITVIGVGGAGGNAVNNMISEELPGVEFVVANTDAQALQQNHADRKIQLGVETTHGLGAGSRPEIGREATEASREELLQSLEGSHMAFITAGMGGGTGTGGAPIVAQLAREKGILTVGVVTKPFSFEGRKRMRVAEEGIERMQEFVDTLIVIPNQNLFRIATEDTTFSEAFQIADHVLYSGVRGVTDLMVVPGLINLDFADIHSVMSETGKAVMGTGEGEGPDRDIKAAEQALSNPLLDDISLKGAQGVLINITGGPDITLYEIDKAANRIGEEVDENASIVFGSTTDNSMEGSLRVSIVATGMKMKAEEEPVPTISLQQPRVGVTQETTEKTGGQTAIPPIFGSTPAAADTSAPAETTSKPVAPAAAAQPAAAATPVLEPVASPAPPAAPTPEQWQEARKSPIFTAPPQEAFIPPPPVGEEKNETTKPGDPFREADVVNGPPGDGGQGRRRAKSWLGLAARGSKGSDKESAASKLRSGTSPGDVPRQRQLDGLDPDDRITARSQADDELLAIPTFLRRQAN